MFSPDLLVVTACSMFNPAYALTNIELAVDVNHIHY